MSEATCFSLQGAVAVVTGATRGIGRATADVLGRAGADVVVVGRSTRDRPDKFAAGTLEDVVEELAGDGIAALGVQADLTVAEQVDDVVIKTMEWRGRCDVLVNSVAYASNGPILSVPSHRWHLGFQAQVITPIQLCQGFVPGMLESGTRTGDQRRIPGRFGAPAEHGPVWDQQTGRGTDDRVPRFRVERSRCLV